MTATGFEKSNFGWQLQQTNQRIQEWLELQLSRWHFPNLWPRNIPSPTLPESLLQGLFWLMVVLFAVWLLVRLSPLLRDAWPNWMRRLQPQALTSQRLAAAKQIDWLLRAQSMQQQGNYREACRALYMAALQRLNDSQLAPYQDSRTDGEYLRLVRDLPRSQPYEILIRTHEQLCFGDRPVSAEVFYRCQQAYQEIAEG